MLPCFAKSAQKIIHLLVFGLLLLLPLSAISQESSISNPSTPPINPVAYGLPGYKHHALPPILWQDTSQHDVIQLMQNSPPTFLLPSLLNLSHKLFTAEAYPPETSSDSLENYMPYAQERILWLVQHGYPHEALRLIGFLPQKLQISWFADTLINIHLALNNDLDACKVSQNSENFSSPKLQKLSIFCALRKNDTTGAEISFALYQDNPNPNQNDTLFSQLINFLLFSVEPPLNQWNIEPALFTPLHASLIALTPQPAVFNDDGAFIQPLILKSLTSINNLPLVTRVRMAERLFLLQPENPRQIQNLYALLALHILKKESIPKNLSHTEQHALYYAQIAAEKLPQQKAQYLNESLALAQKQKQWLPLAKLHEQQILNLSPSQELAWFAPLAAKTLFALGHHNDAHKWYQLIPPHHPKKNGLLAILHTLSPLEPLQPELILPTSTKSLLTQDTYLALFAWRFHDNPALITPLNSLQHQLFNNNPSLFTSSFPTQEPPSYLANLFLDSVKHQRTGHAILLANLMLSSLYTLPPRLLVSILKGLQTLGFQHESMLIARDYLLYRLPSIPPQHE